MSDVPMPSLTAFSTGGNQFTCRYLEGMAMPEVALNGTEIYYETAGQETGPVLVFSNSLGTNLHMWDGQVDALSGTYRIIRYDSRGHGRSGAPAGDYTMDELGNDLVALLDYLNVDKFRYCGLSKGGMVGQWIGTRMSERIERLILSNTSSHMGPPETWNDRIKAVMTGGMEALTEAVIDRWFTKAFQTGNPDDVDVVRNMLLTTPPQGYAGCSAAIRDMNQTESIRAVSAPTLVIAGAEDPATPPDHARIIAANIPGARLHVIANAAHLSNIEQPDEYTATIAEFLK